MIEVFEQQPNIHKSIDLLKWMKRKEQRRRRVAKRMAKRCPLFAVEMMLPEFPEYTIETFEADINRKTRKSKSHRRIKSPMTQQGRYPLFRKAMSNYSITKERHFLEKAQQLRNQMYLPFKLAFGIGKGKSPIEWHFPSSTSLDMIESLKKINDYSTADELKAKIQKCLNNNLEASDFLRNK
jgi:hypothetical protein